jgi:hypothetical protein
MAFTGQYDEPEAGNGDTGGENNFGCCLEHGYSESPPLSPSSRPMESAR